MEGAEDKGGRPFVSPGEKTEVIGPFHVGASLKAWLVENAKTVNKSQGYIVRTALTRLRRSEARKAKAS